MQCTQNADAFSGKCTCDWFRKLVVFLFSFCPSFSLSRTHSLSFAPSLSVNQFVFLLMNVNIMIVPRIRHEHKKNYPILRSHQFLKYSIKNRVKIIKLGFPRYGRKSKCYHQKNTKFEWLFLWLQNFVKFRWYKRGQNVVFATL